MKPVIEIGMKVRVIPQKTQPVVVPSPIQSNSSVGSMVEVQKEAVTKIKKSKK